MSQDLIKALESIAGLPMPAQDNMVSANMRKIAEGALSRHRSSVESVELPTGEAVASLYIDAFGGREADDWRCDLPAGRHELYTASTVRSLIAAAVAKEREECAEIAGCFEAGMGTKSGLPISAAIRARGEMK